MLNGLQRFSGSAQNAYFDLQTVADTAELVGAESAADVEGGMSEIALHSHQTSGASITVASASTAAMASGGVSNGATAPVGIVGGGGGFTRFGEVSRYRGGGGGGGGGRAAPLLAGRKGAAIRLLLVCLVFLLGALAGNGAARARRLSAMFATGKGTSGTSFDNGYSESLSADLRSQLTSDRVLTLRQAAVNTADDLRRIIGLSDSQGDEVRIVEEARATVVGTGRVVSTVSGVDEIGGGHGRSDRGESVAGRFAYQSNAQLSSSGLCKGLVLLLRVGGDSLEAAWRARDCGAVGLVFLSDSDEASSTAASATAASNAAVALPAASVNASEARRLLLTLLSGGLNATSAHCRHLGSEPVDWSCWGEVAGPSPVAGPWLKLSAPNRLDYRRIVDLFLIIRGREQPDRYVVAGSSRRDGGGSGGEAAAALLALCQVLTTSQTQQPTWRPRRSLVLAFWGGGDGDVGRLTELRSRAVAYVGVEEVAPVVSKVGGKGRGSVVRLSATPLLNSVVSAAAGAVGVNGSQQHRQHRDAGDVAMERPFPSGTGQHATFAYRIGIPVATAELVPDGNTTSESVSSAAAAAALIARLTLDAVLRLSESPRLPFDCESLARVAVTCHNWAAPRLQRAGVSGDRLRTAVRRFGDSLRNFAAAEHQQAPASWNERLKLLGRSFLTADGQGLLAGPRLGLGGGVSARDTCFPRLRAAFDSGAAAGGSEAEVAIEQLTGAFDEASSMLTAGLLVT